MRAARVAAKKGYKRIYWFKGGITGWRKFNYTLDVNNIFKGIRINKLRPAQVIEMLKTRDDVFILDVRPQNFKRSPYFIKNAFHCPTLNLTERMHEFPKDKEIVIVDWKMMQSPIVAKYLKREGYNIAGVIRGGIERWIAEGYETEVRKSE